MASSDGPHSVIVEVMEDKGVTTREIPSETPYNRSKLKEIRRSSLRYFHTKAFASYNCVCRRSWKSAHSWCVTDLKTQTLVDKFGQGCQQCERDVTPVFDMESMRIMAGYAVKTYLHRSGRVVNTRPAYNVGLFDFGDMFDALDDSNGPHDQARCETCKLLGTSCWN